MRHSTLVRLAAEVYARPDSDPDLLTASEVDIMITKLSVSTVLAVRGTEGSNLFPFDFSWGGIKNWRDVFRDLRFLPMRTGHGLVHRGFRLSALRWFAAYQDALDCDEDYILTGHSKGAAEAVQLAILLRCQGYKVRQVVVFAEPKSLSGMARRFYNKLGIDTSTYINHGDPIRFTPPWGRTCAPRIKIKAPLKGHAVENYVTVITRL